MIFGRHAERSVTDEMSSFHSERLPPDNGQEGRRGAVQVLLSFAQFSVRGALRFGTSSSAIKPRLVDARYGSDQVTVLADQLQAGFMLRYNKRTVG